MITFGSNHYLNCVALKSDGNPKGTAEDWKRGIINSSRKFSLKSVCVSENRCEKNRCERATL